MLRRRLFFAYGFFLACLMGFGVAEIYLRFFPPVDIHQYLGEHSPMKGVFVQDEDFGLGFVSLETLRANNPHTLASSVSFSDNQYDRTWVCFGNSFVHGQGNLVDSLRAYVPDRPVFKLDRAELLLVHFAQIKTLLENGFHPERILIVLMPVDIGELGKQSLDSVFVTSKGALTYKPWIPPSLPGGIIRQSRFAFTAWVRSNWHHTNSHYHASNLYDQVTDRLQKDFRSIFTSLGSLSQKHNVPVTLIFIPRSRQTRGKSGFAFQDVMISLAREANLDTLDPREEFLSSPRVTDLYIPDGHLSSLGNKVLIDALLQHMETKVTLNNLDGGVKK